MKAHPQLRAVCPRAVLSLCNKQLLEKSIYIPLSPERDTPASPVECVPIPHE